MEMQGLRDAAGNDAAGARRGSRTPAHARRGPAAARMVALAVGFWVVSLGVVGCASDGGLTRDQAIDQVQAVGALSAQLEDAKQQGIDVLAPKGFAAASESFEESIESAEAGQTVDAERLANQGLGRLEKARTDSKNAAEVLREVLQRRQRAITAGAPTLLPERYGKLEGNLRDAAQLAERGDLEQAKEARPDLLRGYSSLELDALKTDATGLARTAIEKARKAGAEKYAPDTYTRAKSELGIAEGILDADRSQVEQANVNARRATDLATRSQFLAELAKEFERRDYDREDILLWYQEQLEDLTKPLEPPISFAQPNHEAIADARNRIAAAVEGRREAEAQLAQARATSTELGSDLQRMQAQQQAAQARYDRVSAMFTEDEAVVYRRGNDVLLTTYGFTFPVGESEIRSSNFPLLNKIAKAIDEFDDPTVVVEGHTDASGSTETNQKLSEARAQKVGAFLVQVGDLPADHVKTEGFGESRPVATNETPQGRALNRRIEILIVNHDDAMAGVPSVGSGPPPTSPTNEPASQTSK